MKLKVLLLVLFSTFFLAACTSSNLDYSRYPSEDDFVDENYYEYEEEPITSDNWECTVDCSGHEAGYDWAEEKGITDPNDCGGNSNSFIEGCEAYANEQQEEFWDDYEDNDDWW